ncbi:zinc finger protein 729 [Eurosta solidaginis]|uniref:zinc finger protein 729 n=1 Tax=Eurosta solidaginis TaxID=178769 RepID=UPI003531067E
MSSSGYTDFANPRLESHMTFVCPECGVEFDSQQDWRRHLNEEHDYIHKTPADFDFKVISESFHECQVCHKWVANANQAIALLQYHRFLHLPFNRTYRCRHCKGGFTRKRALCEHLYRFHSRQIVMAERMRQTENDIRSPQQQSQQRHATDQRSIKDPRLNAEFYLRFICPYCGRNIDKYEQWLKHLDCHTSTSTDLRMHRISGSRNHYCLQCRKLLYTSEQQKLQRHRFTHLPFRLYFKCAFCMVKKQFKSEIFRHFVYAHTRQFNDAKAFIKKPIEWGAKINERLNVELDAILRRNKVTESNSNNPMVDTAAGRGPQKKQTYASEKARLTAVTAQRQRCEQQHQQEKTDANINRKNNIRIIKDYHKIEQKSNAATPTESTTEDDFEELCADVFESIEEESQQQQSPIIVQKQVEYSIENNKSHVKVENFKQEQYTTDEEMVISIEIDAIDDDDVSGTKRKPYNFIRTPPIKRLKLSEHNKFLSDSSKLQQQPTIKCEKDDNNYNPTTSNTTHEPNKKVLLESSIHYLCPECGSEFNEQSSWRTHVFSQHNIENAIQTNFQMLENKESYLCLDCMDVQHTTKYTELQRHRFMHMPFQSYLKCKLCSKTKSSKPKMLLHLQESHNYKCIDGAIKKRRSSDNVDNENEQQKQHQQQKHFYPCKNCNKYFITKERLKLHRTQACEVLRVNGLHTNITCNNNNSTTDASIANNMKLVAHLKQAHTRMKRMLTSGTL